MSDDRTINRIKKLLALAGDAAASDGERDNALRMAYATMAKHNLELHQVQGQPDAPQEARVEKVAKDVYGRPWSITLASYVAKLFFCKMYYVRVPSYLKRDTIDFYFIGLETNAEAAAEVARVLIESVWREAKRRMRSESENATWRRSFCTGAAFKVGDRVADLQRNGVSLEAPMKDEDGDEIPQLEADKQVQRSNALILVDVAKKEDEANEEWIKEHVGGLKKEKSRAKTTIKPEAYQFGREFGGSLNLSNTKRVK